MIKPIIKVKKLSLITTKQLPREKSASRSSAWETAPSASPSTGNKFYIDPIGPPTIKNESDDRFPTCSPSFSKSSKTKHIFTAGSDYGLAEWIIDDSILVLWSTRPIHLRPANNIFTRVVRSSVSNFEIKRNKTDHCRSCVGWPWGSLTTPFLFLICVFNKVVIYILTFQISGSFSYWWIQASTVIHLCLVFVQTQNHHWWRKSLDRQV